MVFCRGVREQRLHIRAWGCANNVSTYYLARQSHSQTSEVSAQSKQCHKNQTSPPFSPFRFHSTNLSPKSRLNGSCVFVNRESQLIMQDFSLLLHSKVSNVKLSVICTEPEAKYCCAVTGVSMTSLQNWISVTFTHPKDLSELCIPLRWCRNNSFFRLQIEALLAFCSYSKGEKNPR